MADVKWIKITTDVFDDEKILLIESLPDADSIIVIWFKLLCLAGKQNNSGVFLMGDKIAYTDKMLATIFRRKETTVQLALQTFQQFGMIELIDGVITIPNWNKHQTLDAYEKKKERDRERIARKRAEQKALIQMSPDKSHDVAKSRFADKEEEKEEEKKEKEKKKKNEKASYTDDPELNEAIIAFVDYRKSIKKPMSERAIELLLAKLNSMTDFIPDQIDILNQSILNGWQGVFPLKKEEAKKHSVNVNRTAQDLDNFYEMAQRFAEEGE